jgi:hypothetical protein
MQILTNCTATNGVPTLATQGVAIFRTAHNNPNGISPTAESFTIAGVATGAAGFQIQLRLWVYSQEASDVSSSVIWTPAGIQTSRGLLNSAALTELSTGPTGSIKFFIPLSVSNVTGMSLRNADRVYLELQSIVVGSLTRLDAWVLGR